MIDTHAHLYMFEENGRKIIDEMDANGLEAIACIGTTVEDSKLSVKIAEENERVFAVVGIYPEFTTGLTESDFEEIKKLAAHKKVVAIGEIGLDYHQAGYDQKSQKEALIRQLEIAHELSLPFCIHCRAAAAEVYDVLASHKHLITNSGLMHCYSEGAEWYKKFLDLGLYLSFSGNITYKKSDRSFLKDIPLDKILVETDSPYLAPEPLRGTKNEPKNTRWVIRKIAEEISVSEEELERITTKNAKKLYYKMDI